MTGKIAPESGQIAPARTLWARRNNVSVLRPENWLSIFLAYLYENHRVTICYVTQITCLPEVTAMTVKLLDGGRYKVDIRPRGATGRRIQRIFKS